MIKTTVVIASLFIFLLFFCLGTNQNPFLPFSVFFPQFHLIAFSALLAILVLGRDYIQFTPITKFVKVHRYKLLPLFGILTTIVINIFVFNNIPHIQDGIHYKYMAEVFAHGELSHVMPVHYEFFRYSFFMVDGTRHFSLFMPGFPIFLIPFTWFDLTSFANPLLTGVNIFLIGRFAQYLFGNRCSTYAMLLFISSPFMMTMGGTWMPHPFAATLTIVAVFSMVRFWDNRRFIFLGFAGSAIGWMVLTRPTNALFLTCLFLVISVLRFDYRSLVKTSTLFFGPIAIGLLILLTYNYTFTGNPLVFIQDIYFNISEPVSDGHRIGLGSGCFHCNGESLPDGGMTWRHGISVTKERIVPLLMETFPHPIFFWFIILSLIFTINNSVESRKKIFLIALFLTSVFGYLLFYFHGNVFGPRYLYEGAIFLVIVAASGIDDILNTFVKSKFRTGLLVVVSVLVGGVLFEAAVTVPRALTIYHNGFWGVGHLLKEMVETGNYRRSVFFMEAVDDRSYGSGLVAMNFWDFEGSENIFVNDLGDVSNSRFMHYMDGWNFYRVKYLPWTDRVVDPVKIEPVLPENVVHVEMEDKFLPYLRKMGYPDYCNVFPVRKHILRHLKFGDMKTIEFSRKQALYCRFVDDGQSYTFGQYFSTGGLYATKLAAVSGSAFGDLDIFMDGELVASVGLDHRSSPSLNEFLFEVEASKGLRTFRIAPHRIKQGDTGYFMIDFVRFEKLGGPS